MLKRGAPEGVQRFAVKEDGLFSEVAWTGADGVPIWLVEVPAFWVPGARDQIGRGRLWAHVSCASTPTFETLAQASWVCVGTKLDHAAEPAWPDDVDDLPDGWLGWFFLDQSIGQRNR